MLDKGIEKNRKYYLRKKSKELPCKLQNLLPSHNQKESYHSGNIDNVCGTFFEPTNSMNDSIGESSDIQNSDCRKVNYVMEVSCSKQHAKKIQFFQRVTY